MHHARPPATGVADLRPDQRRAGLAAVGASVEAQPAARHSRLPTSHKLLNYILRQFLTRTWRLNTHGDLQRGLYAGARSWLVSGCRQTILALSRLCALVLLEILVEHVRVNGCLRGRGGLLGASPASARKRHNLSAGISTCARGMACVPPVWPQPERLETSHWLDACAQTWATRVIRRGY